MRPIAVVTSCSAQGWEQYGKRFVETFGRHWPRDVSLYLVSEDDLEGQADFLTLLDPNKPAPDREFTLLRLDHEFHRRHADNLRAHGKVRLPGDVRWKEDSPHYNFRYDAFRFSKKVFAIELAAQHVKHGRLFWVDADVITFADVPREFLEFLLPEDKALCCLDRGETYHSECGFVGYSLDHDLGPLFIQEFAKLYACDEVFKLQEWHDSWVFDWLRRRMGVPVKPISHCSRHQPFANSKLSRYMDHLKGGSKLLGKTPSRFLITNKDIPYWRDNP